MEPETLRLEQKLIHNAGATLQAYVAQNDIETVKKILAYDPTLQCEEHTVDYGYIYLGRLEIEKAIHSALHNHNFEMADEILKTAQALLPVRPLHNMAQTCIDKITRGLNPPAAATTLNIITGYLVSLEGQTPQNQALRQITRTPDPRRPAASYAALVDWHTAKEAALAKDPKPRPALKSNYTDMAQWRAQKAPRKIR